MRHFKNDIKLDCTWQEYRDDVFEIFDSYMWQKTVDLSIWFCLEEMYEEEMNAKGIDKFCMMVIWSLYEVEKDALEADTACNTLVAIEDFETGEMDSAFTDEDLVEIRKDIQTIKDYIAEHPHLLDEWDEYDHA